MSDCRFLTIQGFNQSFQKQCLFAFSGLFFGSMQWLLVTIYAAIFQNLLPLKNSFIIYTEKLIWKK
uniref:Uncharacterized protein n=1 Tax=viral metagenome TaxID=1070528 RepID=A0A6C0HUJ1_9ZZZZ